MAPVKKIVEKKIICVVDEDREVLESLRTLFNTLGADTLCFSSAEEFFSEANLQDISCLLLEINLPGATGLDILDYMEKMNYNVPTIAMATYSDVPTAVRVMKGKAVDFVEKPFVDGLLIKQVDNILGNM